MAHWLSLSRGGVPNSYRTPKFNESFGRNLPIILNKGEVHPLEDVEYRVRILPVARGESHQNIGNAALVIVVLTTKAAGKIELSEKRTDVAYSCLRMEKLSPDFDGMRR